MAKLNPYLNFNGKTEEAFNFYKSVFGGEFSYFQRFKDAPEAGKVSGEDGDKIMHVSLPIGENTLMATDALESFGQKVEPGSNIYISVHPDSEAEARKIFDGLSKGGKVEMEMQDTFWGALFGSLSDKYGVNWMVNYEKPQES